MSGIGPVGGVAFRAAVLVAKQFAKTSEFDRLCDVLAERFPELGWSGDHFASWAADEAFMQQLGLYLQSPPVGNPEAMAGVITSLVGPPDAETSAAEFARRIAAAIPESLRFAKQGDALMRSEFDSIREQLQEIKGAIAGGQPESVADVFSQFDTVGNSLAKGDAHFYYISHEHGPREPEPDETPGTVMSMFEISDTLTRRIDLVPKNTSMSRSS